MATKQNVDVVVDTKSLNTLKIIDSPVVEETIAGDVMAEDSIFASSLNATTNQIGHAPQIMQNTQFIIQYIPTMFGFGNKERIASALNDFYNKVTGSALQSTSISQADIQLFFKVAAEWRLLIKVCHKMIDQYNMVSSTNDAYGKKHFDSVFGSGAYQNISSNYDTFVCGVNQLAEVVNERFPMPTGNEAYKFEASLIDKTFCDDPNGKGSLIDFKRVFNDRAADTTYFALVVPFMSRSYGWPFWLVLDSSGSSRVKTTYVNFSNTDVIGILKRICDDSIMESWYQDVRPYIKHLQMKGMKSDNVSTDKKKNTSGEWKPVYNPNVLAFIRNSTFVGELLNEYIGGSLTLFEDVNGFVVEGTAEYEEPGSGTTKRKLDGLRVMPAFGNCTITAQEVKAASNFNGIKIQNPVNYLLNLEDYPANKDTIKNAISGLATFVLYGDPWQGDHFPRVETCGPVLLRDICAIRVSGAGSNIQYYYSYIPVTIVVTGAAYASGYVRPDVYYNNGGDTGETWFSKYEEFFQYNFLPMPTYLGCYSPLIAPMSSFSASSFYAHKRYHDIDSLVYYPFSRLTMVHKEMAYHAFYDSASVAIAGSSK